MKLSIILQLFCSLILIDACKIFSKSQNTEIKMLLSVQKNKVSASEERILNLSLTIKNNSQKEVWILNFPEFSTEKNSVFQLMIKKDNQLKISPENLLNKKRIPKASDYKRLKPHETLCISYGLDLTKLVDDYENIRGDKMNTDFGKYVIQVHFADNYLIKKGAIKNLTSNRIEVTYIP